MIMNLIFVLGGLLIQESLEGAITNPVNSA